MFCAKKTILLALAILILSETTTIPVPGAEKRITLPGVEHASEDYIGNYTTTNAQWLGKLSDDGPYFEIIGRTFQEISEYIAKQPTSLQSIPIRAIDVKGSRRVDQCPSVCGPLHFQTMLQC
jgi:hypothetical protein